MIDLRSDTLTRPTAAMRAAIAAAEVGDEQRGEDPTVNALLRRVCELTGKEAALFLPGGTMANNIAVAVHARSGEAVLAHHDAHLIRSESAGPVVLARVLIDALDGADGHFTPEDVTRRAARGTLYEPRTALLCVEQTHNFAGGTIWPLHELQAVTDAARDAGLAIHMDGARLLNAVVAAGTPASDYCALVDSVWLCFTKGLGAPIGAVLAGDADFIERARALKHMVGGALRQAGIAAAACVYALDHHVERLAEDHAHARRLADGLLELGLDVHTPDPQTNMVFFSADHGDFLGALERRGVRIGPVGDRLRAVTHLDVDTSDIDHAIAVVGDVLSSAPEGAHGQRYEYG
ncbi:aminotransferase class I/II-fold pyridoxal phosphate-dependent enzyme [Solirubrobacter ginsenosidimutans]|uniref:Aminotransferase class I/II-fold pyridoxal phosphate-dependent enzyme n=1 Tax=Solirubrobacter ginsenosidimutans TaxID=490573 RepID=A0A9X3MPJ8_9ACTN|nr:threonine aldolase family protein [Solirubrobacter ginsenosidimutans]MDA0159446.1 aminotransferase class I/II-fold pyridoxal phosphate-dependent enzyme [Solirubrobacter ginsenosidimutans]